MSMSLIFLLWICGSVMLLAAHARINGRVQTYHIYFSLMLGPLGLLAGLWEALVTFISMVRDPDKIIWKRKP